MQAATNDSLQSPLINDSFVSPDLTTCATSPPQYYWIFKGACVKISLKSGGATFTLASYKNISIKGSIGPNDVKGTAIIYTADATGNGDIMADKGKAFPKYKAHGTTIIYASAINQSGAIIKPKIVKGKPVLQYIITDSKGIPGKTCGAAVLSNGAHGSFIWKGLTVQAQVKGKTVTISQYEVPAGFELKPKTPLYLAVNCY
jgi:hypothetical protein